MRSRAFQAGLAAAPLLLALSCAEAPVWLGGRDTAREAAILTGGDPDRGRVALRKYGCVSCHTIPGILGANGLVGPPLDRLALRSYLAGRLPNTPENLKRWIQEPRAVDPQTAMPDTGVTPEDAAQIAAYLYTLR